MENKEKMTDTAFEEIKKVAMEVWNMYDDTHGYATEKISKIKDLENIGDNAGYIMGMFDIFNQQKMFNKLSLETKRELLKQMSGSEYLNHLFNMNNYI